MAKYTITYACGHEGCVELFGRNVDRERKMEWLSTCICPDCSAKERKEKAEKLAAQAEADGLPKLTGSEKQVAWAEQLRADFFEEADRRRAKATASREASLENLSGEKIERFDRYLRKWDEAVAYISTAKVQSSWWINNRQRDIASVIGDIIAAELPENISAADDRGAVSEATIFPDSLAHDGAVEIAVDGDCISAKYLKDDDFRIIVKSLKFKWDPDNHRWKRKTDLFSGSTEDRAAELANHLLRNGFAILCWDENVRAKAIDATYVPECKRWISRLVGGNFKDWFSISIPDGEQILFDEARRIKGTRIYRSNVIAPASRHKEVFDFAECNGYSISQGAKSLAEEYISCQANAVKAATPKKESPAPDRLNEILQSSDEVLSDLADD